MSETRKLTAVLVADVVGYSRLAGSDEERTLARLRALRGDLINPAVAAHQGRIVKGTGDGVLAEFRSVADAVRCAIEIQTGMVERNAGVPQEKRIEFRIGVHLGDVVEEDDSDLMGDGVNIAARLEGIAKPGAICLSEDAYRQVKRWLEMDVRDLGSVHLKNIAEPVHAYLVGDKPPKRRTAARPHRLVVALDALAILILVAAGAWWLIAGLPSMTARSLTASSSGPTVAAAPSPAAVSTTQMSASLEPAAPAAPAIAATGEQPIVSSHAEAQPQAKAAWTSPPNAEPTARRGVRLSARRQPSRSESTPSPAVESAANAAEPCFLSAAETNGNHQSCEHLHGLPPRREPAQSPRAQDMSAKNAASSPESCFLSVAEINGNHRSCEYFHGLARAGTDTNSP